MRDFPSQKMGVSIILDIKPTFLSNIFLMKAENRKNIFDKTLIIPSTKSN